MAGDAKAQPMEKRLAKKDLNILKKHSPLKVPIIYTYTYFSSKQRFLVWRQTRRFPRDSLGPSLREPALLVRFQGEGLGPRSLRGPWLVWPTGSEAAHSAGLGQSSEGRRDAAECTDVAAASEAHSPLRPAHWKAPRLNLLSPSPSRITSAL